ncbi:MAG: Gfo/Idh/MocA family oxidoreductase [Planctomycetes bacterium]|nr:Gfo/Idh/MocA family oxidoreductase [Planctomycetota bacterium]
MSDRISRRRMLGRTAAAGAGILFARGGLGRGAEAPSEKLDIAVVGCGGRGGENLRQVDGENIVALCDVDARSAAQAFGAYPKAARFRDYRKMLDAKASGIDAVVVSTPDHMHAPVSLAAMKLGKHVYCEKPLTWSIEEARRMARTAAERKLATQMGTQGMAEDRSRAGIEVIRSGVLGEIREVHVWTDRAAGWWPQGIERPKDTPAVPKELDWDLWLGGAPERPYHPAYCPFRWRGWKDFGTGAVGDMGIHNAAMPWIALELGRPTSAEIIETSGLASETFPAWSTLKLVFPRRGGRGPVPFFWYDGGKRPPADLIFDGEVAKNGAIVVGKKATLYSIEWTGGDWHLLPEGKFRDYEPPAPTLPRAPGGNHYEEWIRACKGGAPSFCNFGDFASAITEAMLVANLALRTGKTIEWDVDAMEARGVPEADPFIRRTYREGWGI